MPFRSFLLRENFAFNIAAQAIVLIAVIQIFVQRGSLPEPILLFAASLFSIFVWLLPVDNVRRANRYMLIQGVIASLASIQEFLFVYLFFVLSMQAMLHYNIRPGLLWNGLLLTLALLANFLFHSEGDLTPGPRALMVTVAFILACVLSAGFARVRRDRDEIHRLMTQLAETNALLHESKREAKNLAAVQERNRLARDLNHSLGHKLTVAIVQLEGAVLQLDKDPGRVAASLKIVNDQLKQGLTELRHIAKQV
ncbi:MAG: histidine kinase [Caldilineaceae bacterium SB0665_bin_25]|nr:histidine kinase [Caldilineaceae bacterium SB0665_bin_25]